MTLYQRGDIVLCVNRGGEITEKEGNKIDYALRVWLDLKMPPDRPEYTLK